MALGAVRVEGSANSLAAVQAGMGKNLYSLFSLFVDLFMYV